VGSELCTCVHLKFVDTSILVQLRQFKVSSPDGYTVTPGPGVVPPTHIEKHVSADDVAALTGAPAVGVYL